MFRVCKVCQTVKTIDQFDDEHRCRECAGRAADPRIGVRLPPGWETPFTGIPDMTVPTEEELAQGYTGALWYAERGNQRLELRWMGKQGKYICRVYLTQTDLENPHESVTFDYPHEVLDWVMMWLQNLGTTA